MSKYAGVRTILTIIVLVTAWGLVKYAGLGEEIDGRIVAITPVLILLLWVFLKQR